MRGHLLVIGAGRHRDLAFTSYREMGYHVTTVDTIDNTPLWLVDSVLYANPRHPEDVISVLSGVDHEFSIMLTLNELAVTTVQKVLANVKKPSLTSYLVRDKFLMRQALRSAGLNCPQFVRVSHIEEAEEAMADFDLPIVIKPVDYGGSGGVTVVSDIGDLRPAIAWALSKSSQCLIESYINGIEYSVEAVTGVNGTHILGITRKEVTPLPVRFEVGHLHPAPGLSSQVTSLIQQTAIDAIRALGIERGASHVELKVDGNSVTVIEVAGRWAGDFIPELVYLSSGVNPYVEEIKAILGEPLGGYPLPKRTAAVKFFYADKAGVLAWREFPASLGDTRVFDSKLWYPTGVPVEARIRSISQRLGYTILGGPESEVIEAYRNIEQYGGPSVRAH